MPRWIAARSVFLALLVSALGCVTTGYAEERVTMHGEIVDLACYMAKGSKGPSHKACAQMCAKKGLPIGLLTENDGVLLLLADDHDSASYETAKTLAGEHAEVNGKKVNKEGIASLVVGSIKQLQPEAAADVSRVFAASKPH